MLRIRRDSRIARQQVLDLLDRDAMLAALPEIGGIPIEACDLVSHSVIYAFVYTTSSAASGAVGRPSFSAWGRISNRRFFEAILYASYCRTFHPAGERFGALVAITATDRGHDADRRSEALVEAGISSGIPQSGPSRPIRPHSTCRFIVGRVLPDEVLEQDRNPR